jgi:MarR family transcriptional regulator, 2-MHQ and catechol-resistance regulon repressor
MMGSTVPKPPAETEDTSAIHVWLILWKAAKAMEQTAIRSISGSGLGLSDFAILELLLHKGPQPVNVIGKRVLLTSGSITTAVDRLEAKKLVRRQSSQADRRSRIVELTPSGRRVIGKAFNKHADDMEQALAHLTTAQRSKLIRLLKEAAIGP